MHEHRFDKLFGLANSQRCERDGFAFARRCPERILSRTSAICADVNRHVRLEGRGAVSPGEVVYDLLKEAVHRLGGNEPVCDDALPDHEALPVLIQLHFWSSMMLPSGSRA